MLPYWYDEIVPAIRAGKRVLVAAHGNSLRALVKHLDDGVDFITVHCGVTRATVERMDNEGRIMEVVSRGGSFTVNAISAPTSSPGIPKITKAMRQP